MKKYLELVEQQIVDKEKLYNSLIHKETTAAKLCKLGIAILRVKKAILTSIIKS